MSKTAIVVLCLALFSTAVLSQGLGQYDSTCPEARTYCASGATLNIQVRGPGSCEGSASSWCSTRAQAVSCRDRDVEYRFGRCRNVDVSADAECFASALATSYTSAWARVSCTPGQYACANAYARGKAVACAVAEAYVSIWVQLGYYTAQCHAVVSSAIEASAQAVSSSSAGVCTNGYWTYGVSNDYDYARAFQEVWANAFATCWAYCDDDSSHSFVTGGANADITEDSTTEIGNNADAQTGDGGF